MNKNKFFVFIRRAVEAVSAVIDMKTWRRRLAPSGRGCLGLALGVVACGMPAALHAADPAPPSQLLNSRLDSLSQQLGQLHSELEKLHLEMATLRQTVDDAALRPVPAKPIVPKIPLDGNDPVLGSSEAKIAIVEFSEFQCSFCKRFYDETFERLKSRYVDQGVVQYIIRDFPLDLHPQSRSAAIAANCAGDQGAYWQMKEGLFINQDQLTDDLYGKMAAVLNLDGKVYERCLRSVAKAREVEDDFQYGISIGVSSTPSFFIGRVEDHQLVNAKRITCAQPFAVFVETIDALLE